MIVFFFILAFFVPIFIEYAQTGLVPHFPTLIVCGFVALTAVVSFFSGMILSTIVQQDKQEFEFKLQQIENYRKRTDC